MDRRLSQMEAARKKVSSLCRYLSWVFLFCLVLYCLIVLLIIFAAIFPPAGFSYVGPASIFAFLPIGCNVFAGGFALFLIMRMLKAIGEGLSPFTPLLARYIKVLAIVLLVGVVVRAFIDPGIQVGSVNGSSSIAYESAGNENHSVYIDSKGLFISIICFALSPIFRYGALLQSEADDLI